MWRSSIKPRLGSPLSSNCLVVTERLFEVLDAVGGYEARVTPLISRVKKSRITSIR
jgi:hypothetical protein